jgi:hypothetical protein
MTSCFELLCTVLYGARGGAALQTGMLPVYWNISSTESSMGLGPTQSSDTNVYQEYFLLDKCGQCLGPTTLSPLLLIVIKPRNLNLIGHSGPVYGCTGIALLLPLPLHKRPVTLWGPLSLYLIGTLVTFLGRK